MEELTIYLEDGRRIRELEGKVAELEREASRLREELRRVEFMYRCETVVNLELVDLCREHGIRYRPGLALRPWEDQARSPLEVDQAGVPEGGDHATARATAPSPKGKEPGGETKEPPARVGPPPLRRGRGRKRAAEGGP